MNERAPLPDELKDSIRKAYDSVKQYWPGFRARRGQLEMIGITANTLYQASTIDFEDGGVTTGQNLASVQAQTGVGKTIGYLVPGIEVARFLKKKLVVSTGTVALQEQLVARDLPRLSDITPTPFTFAIAKGRGRYACNLKLAELAGKASQASMFDEGVWDRPPKEQEVRLLGDLHEKLASGAWNGERDSAPTEIAPLWGKIANDYASCLGKQCQQNSVCPYFNARRKIDNVDVIVANHDLVMSTLSSDSNVLPAPADTLYIFDEAHHLPHVGLSHFDNSHAVGGALKWLERLETHLNQLSPIIPDGDTLSGRAEAERDALQLRLKELMASLQHGGMASAERPVFRFKHGVIDDNFKAMAQEIEASAKALNDRLNDLLMAVASEREREGAGNDEILAHGQQVLGEHLTKVSEVASTWEMMGVDRDPPYAKWIERKTYNNHVDFEIHVSPISAAGTLSNLLWRRVAGAVMTSATIKTLGNFNFYLENTGLRFFPDVETCEVSSPFDYEKQGVFVVPRMKACPSADPAGHTAEIAKTLPEELRQFSHGALVLFTSRKQMEECYFAMPDDVLGDILMQGQLPRADLLQEHAKRVDRGGRSFVFGLQSFGEGLDLPGKYCEGVLISKLPFAPPDSPIEEARAEWMESRNRNPFNEMSLPAASLKLLQWTGRGIRTETDSARIVCFDTRLKTKQYGKRILSGLPPFRMEICQK